MEQDSNREDMLVFYYCMTSFHRFSSLKQHPLICSTSGTSEVWHGMDGFSARRITGWNRGVDQTFSFGEKSTTKLIHVGRIWLLAFVGQRSPIPCWLSPRSHSELPDSTFSSLSHGPLHVQGQQQCTELAVNLTFPSAIRWRKLLLLRGSHD